MTPTTIRPAPSTWMTRPRIAVRAEPARHRPSLENGGGRRAVDILLRGEGPADCGWMPSSGISDAVTREPRRRSGSTSSPVSVKAPLATSAIAESCGARATRRSRRRRLDLEMSCSGSVCQTNTTRDGSRYGSGRSSTALMMANTALLTPMRERQRYDDQQREARPPRDVPPCEPQGHRATSPDTSPDSSGSRRRRAILPIAGRRRPLAASSRFLFELGVHSRLPLRAPPFRDQRAAPTMRRAKDSGVIVQSPLQGAERAQRIDGRFERPLAGR